MEFGSDFHDFEFHMGKSVLDFFPESNLYASGRQALLALALTRGWTRLWVPSYFCEESLECLDRTGIELVRYAITPTDNPVDTVCALPVVKGDAVMVVNFFGLFPLRSFQGMPCEVVEDHTHNLIGDWAIHSSADWCFASLRKTLPIADGGILWSPKGLVLPPKAKSDPLVEESMRRRHDAMAMKSKYLSVGNTDKNEFLKMFRATEVFFDVMPIANVSVQSIQKIESMDIVSWYEQKRRNWTVLRDSVALPSGVKLLDNNNQNEVIFSFILLFDNRETRDKVRRQLIDKSVYPAILWAISSDFDANAKEYGDRILSIHCDGRYSEKDMMFLSSLINESLR